MLNANCPGGVKAPLSIDRKLTEDFRKIAGNKDVSVYWNSLEKQYHLMLRKKFIMYISRPVSSLEKRRVSEHFAKLRSNWYRKNVRKNVRQKEVNRENESSRMRNEFKEEAEELVRDTLVRQKYSVS